MPLLRRASLALVCAVATGCVASGCALNDDPDYTAVCNAFMDERWESLTAATARLSERGQRYIKADAEDVEAMMGYANDERYAREMESGYIPDVVGTAFAKIWNKCSDEPVDGEAAVDHWESYLSDVREERRGSGLSFVKPSPDAYPSATPSGAASATPSP